MKSSRVLRFMCLGAFSGIPLLLVMPKFHTIVALYLFPFSFPYSLLVYVEFAALCGVFAILFPVWQDKVHIRGRLAQAITFWVLITTAFGLVGAAIITMVRFDANMPPSSYWQRLVVIPPFIVIGLGIGTCFHVLDRTLDGISMFLKTMVKGSA